MFQTVAIVAVLATVIAIVLAVRKQSKVTQELTPEEEAGLPDRPRQTILSSLKQLPPHYHELMRTYESRYADEILRLVTVIRQALSNNGALELGETIASRVTAMHSRRGFPSLGLKATAPAKQASKRKRS